jgi:ankyrin repeat protein
MSRAAFATNASTTPSPLSSEPRAPSAASVQLQLQTLINECRSASGTIQKLAHELTETAENRPRNLQNASPSSSSSSLRVLQYAISVGNVDVVEKLIVNAGVSPRAPLNGVVPLAVAVQRQDDVMVRTLLKLGASTNVTVLGVPLLQVAASLNATAIVESLLRLGKQRDSLDVDEAGPGRWTALHVAAARGHTDVLRALIAVGGADLNRSADDGARAVDLAAAGAHTACVRMLLAAGAAFDASTMTRAVASGSADCVSALVAAGASATALDADSKSPLSAAIEIDNFDVGLVLVSAGARVGAAEQVKLMRSKHAAAWLALPHRHAELEQSFRAVARARRLLKRAREARDDE